MFPIRYSWSLLFAAIRKLSVNAWHRDRWVSCWQVMMAEPDTSRSVIEREMKRYSLEIRTDDPIVRERAERLIELAVLANYLDDRADFLDREIERCLRGIDSAVDEARVELECDLSVFCKRLRDIDVDAGYREPRRQVFDSYYGKWCDLDDGGEWSGSTGLQ